MSLGITLPNGSRIVHGGGSNIKRPFADMPSLEMHELDAGTNTAAAGEGLAKSFHGQLGFIPFTTSVRLPRHVHLATLSAGQDGQREKLVTERILVLNGVALVQLNGLTYVIPSGALVTIAPGVPHTWTACPANVTLPDGEVSDGEFLMVYEYEDVTGFFPTDSVETLQSAEDYVGYTGDLDRIRFPQMTAEDVMKESRLVWGTEVMSSRDGVWV